MGSSLQVDGREVEYWMANAHCKLFNYTGHPAAVLPYRLSEDGLPIGVQLVGKRWAESHLLAVAGSVSQVTVIFQRPGLRTVIHLLCPFQFAMCIYK